MCKCRFHIASLLVAAAAMAGASLAHADTFCGDRGKLIETLAQKYDEVPSAFGIIGQKNLIELFVSKSGSWTMLMTPSSGATCIMAAGQSWEQFPANVKMTGL